MFMLMGIVYAIWILPETYCKSLEEMVCFFLSRLLLLDSFRTWHLVLEKEKPTSSGWSVFGGIWIQTRREKK